MRLLIGLDIGTTALKAAVFDTAGTLLAVSTQEYSLLTPQVNYVEVPGEVYWDAFRNAVADLKTKHPMGEEDEVSLGISAPYEGAVVFAAPPQGASQLILTFYEYPLTFYEQYSSASDTPVQNRVTAEFTIDL